MTHWTEPYVGRPYVPGVEDCAALAGAVQREVFGRNAAVPAERPDCPQDSAEMVAQVWAEHARRLDVPEEGALVLMRRGTLARPWHIGTYFVLGGEGWILHTTRSAGASTIVRVRDLSRFGLQVEGYYTWI